MFADWGAFDLVGIVGSLMICTGYFMVSTGRINGETIRFQLLNAGGASLLLLSLYFRPNPGAILIEAIWLLIALVAIIRILGKRRG